MTFVIEFVTEDDKQSIMCTVRRIKRESDNMALHVSERI